jgi:hypothetical protein
MPAQRSRSARKFGGRFVEPRATVLGSAGYGPMSLAKPPPTLRPMKDFDPSEPAILHDRVTDTIISWSGEEADAFRRTALDRQDGTIAWHRFVFDGWGNVLGG